LALFQPCAHKHQKPRVSRPRSLTWRSCCYVAERDLITYVDGTDASLLRSVAGQVAIFFPVDVHMPSLQLRAAPVLVRKSVVKVPVA
jgi:beta-galactosidase beta subunit